MKIMTPIAQENIRKIHAAGGVVACGTDQSSGPAVHRELELLAAAGIAPLDVIRIATYNSAVFLGKADQLGSVQAGRLAFWLGWEAANANDKPMWLPGEEFYEVTAKARSSR